MTRAGAAAVALVAVLAAGCGSGTETAAAVPSGPPTRDLRIGLQEYDLVLSAGALLPGPATVTVTNTGATGHDVRLLQQGRLLAATEVLSPGGREVLTFDVAPGVPVDLDCTVGGHAGAGMTAQLGVAAG